MTRPCTGVQTSALWNGAPAHRLRWSIVQYIALISVIGALTVLGCGGGSNKFSGVTHDDLANRAFTFPTGAAAILSKAPCGPQDQGPCGLGLPQGQAFTFQFGNFGGTSTAPARLDSNGSTASGTVTLAFNAVSGKTVTTCIFQFTQSTFPANSGPQAGSQFTSNPCEFDHDHSTMRLTPAPGETEVSAPFVAIPTTNAAFILTSGVAAAGSYSVVELTSRFVFKDISPGGVDSAVAVGSDARARFFNGRVYVINGLGVDNIQVLDPQQGFTIAATNGTLLVDSGSDPQDIAFINTTKAYVSRLHSARLLIINPITLTRLGELDLSSLTKLNDSDGSPDPAFMLVHNGLVYVILRHIDFNTLVEVANGEVVVIDPTNDRILTKLQLHAKNPESELQFSPTLNRILVSSVGNLAGANGGLNDGGIDAINPDTNTVDPQFVVDEATMGGDITAFALSSRIQGFAVVHGANATYSLVTFNPSTGQRLHNIVGPLNVPLSHVAINSRNEVYLAVADTHTSTPGLRIFDAITESEITTTPLNVGVLPPAFILFIE